MGQTASQGPTTSSHQNINGDTNSSRLSSAAYQRLPIVDSQCPLDSHGKHVRVKYDILQDRQLALNLAINLSDQGQTDLCQDVDSADAVNIDDVMQVRQAAANQILQLTQQEIQLAVEQLIIDRRLDKLPCEKQTYNFYAISAIMKDGKYVDGFSLANMPTDMPTDFLTKIPASLSASKSAGKLTDKSTKQSDPRNDFCSDCLLKYVTSNQAVLEEALKYQWYSGSHKPFLTIYGKRPDRGTVLADGFICGDYIVHGVYHNFHACQDPCQFKAEAASRQQLNQQSTQKHELRLQQIKAELAAAIANGNFKLFHSFFCSFRDEAYYVFDAVNNHARLQDISVRLKASYKAHRSPLEVIIYYS